MRDLSGRTITYEVTTPRGKVLRVFSTLQQSNDWRTPLEVAIARHPFINPMNIHVRSTTAWSA